MNIEHKHIFGDMTRFDRYFVGLDRVVDNFNDILERTTKTLAKYPPYNIRKLDENRYTIEMAVAGFGKQDLEITLEDGKLVVAGKSESKDADTSYLYKGLSDRSFKHYFTLSDRFEIKNATLMNGMLKIILDIAAQEPKKIEIDEAE